MPCLTDVGVEKRTRANPNLPFQARLRGATGGDLIVGRVKAVTGPQIVVGRCAQRRCRGLLFIGTECHLKPAHGFATIKHLGMLRGILF
jgi:hypothetical protein